MLLVCISGRQFSLYPDSFTPEFIPQQLDESARYSFSFGYTSRLLRATGTAFKYLIACAFFLTTSSFVLGVYSRCNLRLYFWSSRESETWDVARRCNENKLIAHVKSFSGFTVMKCVTSFPPLTEFVCSCDNFWFIFVDTQQLLNKRLEQRGIVWQRNVRKR